MDAEQTVLAFIEASNRLDYDRVHALMADDIVYHNMPWAPIEGRDAARALLEGFGADEVDWEVLHIATAGNVVLTERVDRFRIGGQHLTVPVMGTFEVRDGRITRWRDYFDPRVLKPARPA